MGLSLDIQWSIIRTIFYGEALLSTVLTVPLISPKVWNFILRSRFVRQLYAYWIIYVIITVCLLIYFFVDSVRILRRSSHLIRPELQKHFVEVYVAQRNFYVSSLLLLLRFAVIRLGILLSRVATSEQALRLAGTGVRQSVTMFHPDFDCRHGLNPNSNLGCRLSDVNVNADPAAVLAANRWLRQRLAAKDEELLMARNERNALQLQLEDLALMHRELCKRHERLENKLKSKNT